jgi:hypothetical protein
MQDGSRKELLLDDLCEIVGSEGVAEVHVGSHLGIGKHYDRRPFLRQVAHEALEARYRSIVADKPAKGMIYSKPIPVVALRRTLAGSIYEDDGSRRLLLPHLR